MTTISTTTDPSFFDIGVVIYDKKGQMYRDYNSNLEDVYDKTVKKVEISKSVYKKKFNVYYVSAGDQKNYIFDMKFGEPVHKLTFRSRSLKEIKSLPKGLMSVWFQGLKKGYKLNLKTVPKTIVSIFYRWADYTLGDDLRSLKNLKVLGVPDNMVFSVPKLPKGIEYVDFSGCQIGLFDENGLDNFKLSSYPNLKYINFSKNYIKKIPEEWKKAKKDKKLTIIYDKQYK